MSKILKLVSRFVMNGAGSQTVEVELTTDGGVFRAALPHFRRFDQTQVINFMDVVKSQMAPCLVGASFSNFNQIDSQLQQFGFEISSCVYLVVYQALATYNRSSLVKFISRQFKTQIRCPRLVVPVIVGPRLSLVDYSLVSLTTENQIINIFKVLNVLKANQTLNQNNQIQCELFDSEEPLRMIENALVQTGMKSLVGVGLNFNSKQYEKNGKYDLHVKQEIKSREPLNSSQLKTLIISWLQNPQITLIQNLIQEPNEEIDTAVAEVQKQRIADKKNQLYVVSNAMTCANTQHVSFGQIKSFNEFLNNNEKPHKMYEFAGESEDSGMCHYLCGLGYEFVKVNMYGAENTSKINELMRISDWM
ncbi:Enolase [Hexamita inflata]|uniref:phosphopyruvate hydratase n=1 Tax=Hexamita inflata TaxID=28002 RepID=A0ABP1HMA7_9EUKA